MDSQHYFDSSAMPPSYYNKHSTLTLPLHPFMVQDSTLTSPSAYEETAFPLSPHSGNPFSFFQDAETYRPFMDQPEDDRGPLDCTDTPNIKMEPPLHTLSPRSLLTHPLPPSSPQAVAEEMTPMPPSPRQPQRQQQQQQRQSQHQHQHQQSRSSRSSRSSGRRRRSSYGQSSDSYDAGGTGRVAHNLVERKYRDGLNAELNRLRLVLPHIGAIRQPTKAQILASAANYIEELKETCERLQSENETLQYGSVKAKRHRRSA